MILDDLKAAWQLYDRKLAHTQFINEKILLRMIKERSTTRLASIQREYRWSFIYMFAMLLLFTSILVWNPFDFNHLVQYTPTILQTLSILVVLVLLYKGYVDLDVDMNHNNLDTSLKKIILVYEKSEKVLGWAGVSLMVSGLLFPLSFLPKIVESSGIWKGLGLVLIQTGVVLGMYILVAKLGFLKDKKKHAAKFKDDLNELEELKTLSAELRE